MSHIYQHIKGSIHINYICGVDWKQKDNYFTTGRLPPASFGVCKDCMELLPVILLAE